MNTLYYQNASRPIVLIILQIVLLASEAIAQVTNCNGVWTNKPCSTITDEDLHRDKIEKISAHASIKNPLRKELSDKKSLLHKLTMKMLEAEREYAIKFDITDAREMCENKTSTVTDCKKVTIVLEEKIDQRIAEAKTLKAQADANKLQEKRNQIEAKKEATSAVTIIEQKKVIIIRPRKPRRDHSHSVHQPKPPSASGGVGISVSAGSFSGSHKKSSPAVSVPTLSPSPSLKGETGKAVDR